MDRHQLKVIMEDEIVKPNRAAKQRGYQFMEFGGVKIKINTEVDNFESNICAQTMITNQDPYEVIDTVIDRFKEYDISEFSWFVSDSTRPKNFSSCLRERAFELEERNLGLYVASEEALDISYNTELEFKKIDVNTLKQPKYRKVIREGYGASEEFVDNILKSYSIDRGGGELIPYAVIHKKDRVPITTASLLYPEKYSSLAKLSGAATLPEYRGMGAYSGILKYRITHAFEKDIDFVYTMAKEHTSAPILKKRGFFQLTELKRYVLSLDNN